MKYTKLFFSMLLMFSSNSNIIFPVTAVPTLEQEMSCNLDDFDAQLELAVNNGLLQNQVFTIKPSFGERILQRFGNWIAKVSLMRQQLWKKIKGLKG